MTAELAGAFSPALASIDSSARPGFVRPTVAGKFIQVGQQKLYPCGVTYGAFEPGPGGTEFHDLDKVRRDFIAMAAAGLNAVRIPHAVPPPGVLDVAFETGLWVMVGLSAEQYVGYLIDRKGAPDTTRMLSERAKSVAEHPALLCFALGNEIAAPTARWIGNHRIESYLHRLFDAVKRVDPAALVTYVNYPSTEYLDLPFLDFISFNVYLETKDAFDRYLSRLHSLAGDRPLVMTELGLDSLRNGEAAQAWAVEWQLRSAFEGGAAGAFVFSWTDEWFRAEQQVDDWAFGLTDRERRPKAALAAASRVAQSLPFACDQPTPRISIVVCAFNAEPTLAECLEGVRQLDYPDYEVIVVDDGSTDATPVIAEQYDVRLVRTTNFGLSSARNTGAAVATGEIVAYLDSDARPDPHWLRYIAHAFTTTDTAGVGGPNLAPPESGMVEQCVAQAPGGPVHVMVSDREAEHLPGCNLALRKSTLEALGGFDPQFRAAGDDVDICWRIRDSGSRLEFAPAALVWHHRRNRVRAYWNQQRGYGKAEALLEAKWPERYNAAGHVTWAGRIYGDGVPQPLKRVQRIYHGPWGTAPFQSLYERAPNALTSLPLTPEWWLLIAALATLSVLAVSWVGLIWALPVLLLAVTASVVQALLGAHRAAHARQGLRRRTRARLMTLTAWLHLLQPLARLRGRLAAGLTPWRHKHEPMVWPRRRRHAVWQAEGGRSAEDTLGSTVECLRGRGYQVHAGGAFARWDLEVRTRTVGGARALLAVEDHGGGAQHVRFAVWPRFPRAATFGAATLAGLGVAAALDDAWFAAVVLGAVGVAILALVTRRTGAACALLLDALAAAIAPPDSP
jgi:GT2 family glycosyltransferase